MGLICEIKILIWLSFYILGKYEKGIKMNKTRCKIKVKGLGNKDNIVIERSNCNY